MVCCHNDGDPTNNVPENLRWDTKVSDCDDRAGHGRDTVGVRNGQAKLNPQAVAEIRRRYAAGGVSLKTLGGEYGVTADTIHCVVTYETWNR